MAKRANKLENHKLPVRKKSIIKTTLYELIELVRGEIRPGEENLVPAIVNHIMTSGHAVKWNR